MPRLTRRAALATLCGSAATGLYNPTFSQEKAKGKGKKAKAAAPEITFPPELPGGKAVVTDTSDEFLKPADTLRDGVAIAKTPPTIDFAYFPGQTTKASPGRTGATATAVAGKYYTSIGDHLAPAGNAFVFEYDAAEQSRSASCST